MMVSVGIGYAAAGAAIAAQTTIATHTKAADSQCSGLKLARPRAHNAAIETLRNATRN
jgi:hypothetical protein